MSRSKGVQGKQVDPKKLKIRAWRHAKFPYSGAVASLKNDIPYFVAGIRRQLAHSAAQGLSKRVGEKVEALSSMYEGEKGYTFFKGGLEKWAEKGRKEGWLAQ